MASLTPDILDKFNQTDAGVTHLLVFESHYQSSREAHLVPTFEILNEAFQFHFTRRFDVRVVQICVQHDDSEGD